MRQPVSSPEKINAPLFILGILFIFTLGTSIIPASWFGITPPARQYAPLNLGNLAQPENLASDTDGNGSISWRELVASSLDISPDQAQLDIEVDPQALAVLNDENNLTASFSKNAYLASTALKGSPMLNEETQQDIINQLIKGEVQKLQPITFSAENVTTVADTKTSIKKYGNDVASAMNGLITTDSIVKDLTSINRYLGTAEEDNLLHLVQNAKKADEILSKLQSIQVPTSAVSHHLDLLKRVGEYRDMLINLSVANTDALRATAAIQKYQGIVVGTLRIYPLLGEYFTSKNITFSSSEPGYVYIVGYTGEAR